jgi:hypothetical protein
MRAPVGVFPFQRGLRLLTALQRLGNLAPNPDLKPMYDICLRVRKSRTAD